MSIDNLNNAFLYPDTLWERLKHGDSSMLQLADIYAVLKCVRVDVELFGHRNNFLARYHQKLDVLRDSSCAEKGITPEEAEGLPHDTVFESAEVLRAFEDLKRFLESSDK